MRFDKKMHVHGKIACLGFASTAIAQLVLHRILMENLELEPVATLSRLVLSAAISILSCSAFSRTLCGSKEFAVVWRSQLLGGFFVLGCLIVFHDISALKSFGWYTCFMVFFHFTEFIVTSLIRPKNLSTDSFLLNHSKAYGVAALVSWLEFFIEQWLFPGLKEVNWICISGIILCTAGEITRKLAMLTAGSNFDHLIRLNREDEHELVTSGIYGLCRHPSYVGWFYWSIGTQLILCNPLCCVAYAFVSWRFFAERIFEEEMTLLYFFGEDYDNYQRTVPTGLPFIRGYVAD